MTAVRIQDDFTIVGTVEEVLKVFDYIAQHSSEQNTERGTQQKESLALGSDPVRCFSRYVREERGTGEAGGGTLGTLETCGAPARSREAQARAMTVTMLPDRVLCGHCTKSARAVLDFVQNADRIVIAAEGAEKARSRPKPKCLGTVYQCCICVHAAID
jgi:hypothetical protein